MGFLDRAKKLAEQAKAVAEQAKGLAEDALAEAKARSGSSEDTGRPDVHGVSKRADPRLGTPYVPGMLGRDGWRERGLTDPAALLPADERDRAGIPAGTRSEIVEEPFGMGRRWSAAGRSAGLFHRLHDEHLSWEPPAGRQPVTAVPGAWTAGLPDGRTLVFLEGSSGPVVLELNGMDDAARLALTRAVAVQLAGG